MATIVANLEPPENPDVYIRFLSTESRLNVSLMKISAAFKFGSRGPFLTLYVQAIIYPNRSAKPAYFSTGSLAREAGSNRQYLLLKRKQGIMLF
jgi:hypothetical protein